MKTHTDRDIRMLVARSHGAALHLAGSCLQMGNLPHVDLRGANLVGANLRGAMLWGARMDGACLDGADLTCANLTWSSLLGCSMRGTLLVEADLDEATVDDLRGAVTAGADLVTVTYTISNALMEKSGHEMASARETPGEAVDRIDAKEAALLEAHRQSASPSLRVRGAAGFARKYEQLELAKARVLSDGDLQELFRWSVGTGNPLNLRGCNLSGADLRNASLRGACLAFTDATGADIRGVDLTMADLYESVGWRKMEK